MMRRNSTSRLVHTLSPDSTRPCEIAATDMALSRGVWSRDGVSDMPAAAHARGGVHDTSHDPLARQNQSRLQWIKHAVTSPRQGARVGRSKNPVRLRGVRNNMAIKFGRPIEMRDSPGRDAALKTPPLDLIV